MRRFIAPAALALSALLLAGCAPAGDADSSSPSSPSKVEETVAPPAEPLDLTGEWKQTNSNAEDSYQTATITEETISVDWVVTSDSTSAIYWVGTYEAPKEDVDAYSWESVNDTSQTETALLASDAPTKTFTYENGVLKYELTAMGVTMTVEMEKQ
ncbi:hypothetical protein H9651_11940 [Microbacterium sp. Sa4CUA7]|uniref:Lipoprotein n=1 Tax=Microbacterium pullorum TaxID=2762236 RepID=A0ABR8S4I4_9MICO|nr:hypothetical protein [Microbacterium pullorum]MBD7958355.1 hypothetical protein [Microbacterium pullorum]